MQQNKHPVGEYLFKDTGRMYEFKDRVHQQMVERIDFGQSRVSTKARGKKKVSKQETLPISDFGISIDSKNCQSNTQSAKKLYLPESYMGILR